MEPRVSKREKKLHLSYELTHRIHCSRVYPVVAPNGSTVILYGHDRGLRVLWRGGRRFKEQSSARSDSQTNSFGKDQDVIVIDEGAEDTPSGHQPDIEDQYEAGEDVQDSDHPFPTIIQDVNVDLSAGVLHLSVPSFSTLAKSDTPTLAKTHMIVAAACSDARVLLLTIPLAPPKPTTEQRFIEEEIDARELEGDSNIAHDLAVKVMAKAVEQPAPARNKPKASREESDGQLFIAAVAAGLNLWSFKLNSDSISNSTQNLLPIMHSSSSGSTVSFHPSQRFVHLLLANPSGIVRIYDAFATPPSEQTRSSTSQRDLGRWIVSYSSPFHSRLDSPTLERRKKILSAAWILGGRAILVLLEDGEWGIWDSDGSANAGKGLESFALRGFLGSSSVVETVESGKQKKTGSKLAPMTPNTRKTKAENLFSGPPKVPGVASTGGTSISSSSNRFGQIDESVIIWYNNDIYSIPSMQAFWQRSMNTGGGFGSLYAPGLTHISDVNLMNENITSISQFASKSTTANLGQINSPRDLLISAEHRFVILHHLQPLVPPKALFQQELAARPAARDQRMLDAGEMDLDGIDGMLDDMRTRRVGFAH